MKTNTIRIQKINIKNLKNVGNGTIQFSCNTKDNIFEESADILGLYGQNGSGKTTLIYSLSLLKEILMGVALPRDILNYIKCGNKSAVCSFEFSMTNMVDEFYKVLYEFELKERSEGHTISNDTIVRDEHLFGEDIMHQDDTDKMNAVYISNERVSFSKLVDKKWTKMTPVLNYSQESESILLPKIRLGEIVGGDKHIEDELRLSKLMSKKMSKSFIFSNETKRILTKSNLNQVYKDIILNLHDFALFNLNIISNTQAGIINANIALPFSFVLHEKDNRSLLKGSLNLNGISSVPEKYFESINEKIIIINTVLKVIIPGLTIKLVEVGRRIEKNNELTVLTQLVANRGKNEIPLKYESDGIKKLISILYGLILMVNNPSTTLAVDEFDSGIFEYLLGEILKIVEESGKGQLIFTSHNLRPLETINKKSVMFTTANEDNRYIRFKNVKTNNNFRDLYFHDIILGGQNESIYEATNPFVIRRAFKMAGDEDAK